MQNTSIFNREWLYSTIDMLADGSNTLSITYVDVVTLLILL